MNRQAESNQQEELDPKEIKAIQQLRQGDVEGLAYLVKKYELLAVRSAVLITCERDLAEDVVQEAFIRAYKHIGQFQTDQPFRPWFIRSVINAALRATRRRDRQQRVAPEDIEEDLISQVGQRNPPPEILLERAETSREVWRALRSMTPKQRSILVLRYFAGLSVKDLSQVTGSPLGTVKWRLSAAREQLKRTLLYQRVSSADWEEQGAKK